MPLTCARTSTSRKPAVRAEYSSDNGMEALCAVSTVTGGAGCAAPAGSSAACEMETNTADKPKTASATGKRRKNDM
ncbi:hypothetical protein D9M70_566120 [compost metagenome]